MIFVTGCARSGTSLTTQILKAHGCNLGTNVNALYENVYIRQNVLKPYLSRVGADPLGQRKLPDTYNLPPLEKLAAKVKHYIPGDEPRCYKDAKLTLVWPVFADAFPTAKWVVVRRDKNKIVDSCLRTNFMHASDKREYWEAWVDAHEDRFDDMSEWLDVIEVWPDQVMENPQMFAPVAWHCGLDFNAQAVEDCIDRTKWHKAA